MIDKNEPRLGTAFHESFSLSRTQLGQVLEALARVDESVNLSSATQRQQYLRETSHLGTNQVKAVPSYALGAGMVGSDYQPSNFGESILANDRLLDKSATQWLIHYHLAAPNGPGPVFWNKIAANYFRSGDVFTSQDIAVEIARIAADLIGREVASRTAKDASRVFLGTYTQHDALGKLGVLEDIGDNRYLVLDPEPPSAWVFGLALLDYWNARFGDRLTINLSDLLASGGLGDLFLMGAGRVNAYLRQLQEEGYVEVYRVAPPYQVVLLRKDAGPLLQKMYEH